MSCEIEHEDRIMLNQEVYNLILNDLKTLYTNIEYKKIENMYFDTSSFLLRQNGSILRLRKENDEYQLTMKIKGKNGDIEVSKLLSHIEYKNIVEKNKFPLSEIDEHLTKLEIKYDELTKWGELKTDRLEIKVNDCLIVLDKNKYLGIVDYDLEIESNSNEKSHAIIEYFCDKYQLMYDPNYLSKSKRLFQQSAKKLN